MKIIIPLLFLFALGACTPLAPRKDIRGTYHSHTQWGGNDIYIVLHPDSSFGFRATKEFCPGTKIFCSAGIWRTAADTLLMEQDNKTRWFKNIFPEMKDTITNVLVLSMTAKYVLKDNKLYEYNATDKRGIYAERYLDKVK